MPAKLSISKEFRKAKKAQHIKISQVIRSKTWTSQRNTGVAHFCSNLSAYTVLGFILLHSVCSCVAGAIGNCYASAMPVAFGFKYQFRALFFFLINNHFACYLCYNNWYLAHFSSSTCLTDGSTMGGI